jgi:hypothetical protein
MAWLHGSLKILENGKHMGRYIEHNNRYTLWQLWMPQFRVFDLQMLRIGGSFDDWMPQVDCAGWCSYFVMILKFCIDLPFGFQPIRIIIFVHVSNFCLDRPFGFSVHRDAHFCLSHFLRFATYRAHILTEYFLTAPAFIGRVSLLPSIICKSHCTWAFVTRHPLAPGVWLKR